MSTYDQSTTHMVYSGDVRDQLGQLPDQSIAACITSPPYALQRTAQYGGIPEVQYPTWTVQWMKRLRPKLKPDGSVLIVIRSHLKNGVISDYVLRTRLALRDDGWNECEELIWLKRDGPPLGSIHRPRRAWESILWFSMTQKPYTDLKADGAESKYTGGFSYSNRFATGHSMPVHSGQNKKYKPGRSRVSDVFVANVGAIDRGVPHPAMYPRTLTDKLVKTFSRPGDTILDPFCGSGTTCLSAVNHGRRAIGIERDSQYASIARHRVAAAHTTLLGEQPLAA